MAAPPTWVSLSASDIQQGGPHHEVRDPWVCPLLSRGAESGGDGGEGLQLSLRPALTRWGPPRLKCFFVYHTSCETVFSIFGFVSLAVPSSTYPNVEKIDVMAYGHTLPVTHVDSNFRPKGLSLASVLRTSLLCVRHCAWLRRAHGNLTG